MEENAREVPAGRELLTPAQLQGLGWELGDGFKVLNHPARRRILNLLNENGAMDCKSLTDLLHIKSNNMTYHMLVLRPYVVRNDQGLFELNKLGEHLVKFISNGKRVFHVENESGSSA